MSDETAVAIMENTLPSLANPESILQEAHRAAKALNGVIDQQKNLKVRIGSNDHIKVEAWQTVGRFYKLRARVRSTEYVEIGKYIGFKATADLIDMTTNEVVSSADALCMDDEDAWKDRCLNDMESMAQTRACGKVFRQDLSWVVVLAGYQPTPYEEMGNVKQTAPEPSSGQKRASQPKSQRAASTIDVTCPACGKSDSVIVAKFGDHKYHCFKKKEGCGHNFSPEEDMATEQEMKIFWQTFTENEDCTEFELRGKLRDMDITPPKSLNDLRLSKDQHVQLGQWVMSYTRVKADPQQDLPPIDDEMPF